MTPILEAPAIPAHVCSYWPTRDEALDCPRGDMTLFFCTRCGFMQNTTFDEAVAEYTGAYENSLHCSEFFQGYIAEFADQILERHDAKGGVLEIGCGNGEFLSLLCERGQGHGIGFDPSYEPGLPETSPDGRLRFVREYYDSSHKDVEAGLVICRQVLEHIPDPGAFLRGLRATIGERDTKVVFEVPNFAHALKNLALWDVVYEHPNYFSPGTLARIFAEAGFDVHGTWETYASQFIALDASPSKNAVGSIPEGLFDLDALSQDVAGFKRAYEERVGGWSRRLAHEAKAGRRVVVWGAGARGVTFLNLADRERVIEMVVDINDKKHGKHVVGTGQKVVPPSALVDSPPDVVIVMNPIYKEEIARDLTRMGLSPEMESASAAPRDPAAAS